MTVLFLVISEHEFLSFFLSFFGFSFVIFKHPLAQASIYNTPTWFPKNLTCPLHLATLQFVEISRSVVQNSSEKTRAKGDVCIVMF